MKAKKRIFAASDIHGHYTLLREALDEAGFDPENSDHLFVCCGDLFDRGNESFKVYEFVRALKNKVLICGNHDENLLQIFKRGSMSVFDIRNGVERTVTDMFGEGSIGPLGELQPQRRAELVDELIEFIEHMSDYYESENYIFTHGWLPTEIGNDGNRVLLENWRDADCFRWNSARFTEWTTLKGVNDMVPDKTIVCGHRPTRLAANIDVSRSHADSSIYYGKRMIAIDAGAVRSGRVNVFVTDDIIF